MSEENEFLISSEPEYVERLEKLEKENQELRLKVSELRLNQIGNYKPVLMQYICDAIHAFGGKKDGVFNTAAFQQAVNKYNPAELLPHHCEHLLVGHPQVVRLKGGCHWMLLPAGYEREK